MSEVDTLRDALFGNPPQANWKPSREGTLAAFTALHQRVIAVVSGVRSYATVADLPADPVDAPIGTQARVYDDPTEANNTYWIRQASGWVVDQDYIDSVASVVEPLVDTAALYAGFESRADLIAFTPQMSDGDRTTVKADDTGTHAAVAGEYRLDGTAATVGELIPNEGVYTWDGTALLRTGSTQRQLGEAQAARSEAAEAGAVAASVLYTAHFPAKTIYDETGLYSKIGIDMAAGLMVYQLRRDGQPIGAAVTYTAPIYPEAGIIGKIQLDPVSGFYAPDDGANGVSQAGTFSPLATLDDIGESVSYEVPGYASSTYTEHTTPQVRFFLDATAIGRCLHLILGIGQSKMEGYDPNATAMLDAAALAAFTGKVLGFTGGPRRTSPISNIAVEDLRERVAAGGLRSTPISGCAYNFAAIMEDAFPSEGYPTVLAGVAALGGRTLLQIGPGYTDPSGGQRIYDALMSLMDDAVTYALNNGFDEIKVAIVHRGHETQQAITGMSNEIYARQMRQRIRQTREDIMRRSKGLVRSQPVYLISQVGTDTGDFSLATQWGHPTRFMPLILDGMDGVYCYGPDYQNPRTDSIHDTCTGNNFDGFQAARALADEWYGNGARVIRSQSTAWLTADKSSFRINYMTPAGVTALAKDDGSIITLTNLEDDGFYFRDGSASPPTISSVTVTGLNVDIVLSGPSTGPAPEWGYALLGTTAAVDAAHAGYDGPVYGPRGTLRGNVAHTNAFGGTAYDFALAERQPIPSYRSAIR